MELQSRVLKNKNEIMKNVNLLLGTLLISICVLAVAEESQTQKELNEKLFWAAKKADSNTVLSLIREGADPDAEFGIGAYTESTPLTEAALEGKYDIINLLLQNGARVDKQDLFGNTALIYAARHDYMELIELLLRHGASIDLQNNVGNTALMDSVLFGAEKYAPLFLLAHGANKNLKNNEGETAYDIAVERRFPRNILYMLRP